MLTAMSGHYMPLTWLTHGLDYVLWGMRPAGYHVVNVLLHALAAAAAYFVALRVLAAAVAPEPLARDGSRRRWPRSCSPCIRCAWSRWRGITERRDVLCGVFFLLAVVCLPPRRRGRHGPAAALVLVGGGPGRAGAPVQGDGGDAAPRAPAARTSTRSGVWGPGDGRGATSGARRFHSSCSARRRP